jgi:hypothetical protein
MILTNRIVEKYNDDIDDDDNGRYSDGDVNYDSK